MNNFKCTLTFLLLVAYAPHNSLSQRSIDPEIQRKIDDYVQNEFLPAVGIPALGLSVVQNDGEVLFTTGYGPANHEKGIKNGNSTQFLIGSITKSFTAILAAKLLHETFPDMGESVLDVPIRKLVPQANFTLSDRYRSEHATFRDLLSHRLCLHSEDVMYFADPFKDRDELNYRQRYTGEMCTLRTEFHNHNGMLVYAGDLAAMLANKSYEDAIQDIFIDLGMTNTTVLRRTDDYTQMPYRAMPYYVKDGELHAMNTDLLKRLDMVGPTGGIFATPDDMVRYLRFHLNKGNLDGVQVVPKEVVEWAHKPGIMVNDFDFKENDREEEKILSTFAYGLGFQIGSYDGWEYLHHNGYFPPYFSRMTLYPGKKLAIFSTTNIGPRHVDFNVLHSYIFEVLNGNSDPAVNTAKVSKQLKAEEEAKKQKSHELIVRFLEAKQGHSEKQNKFNVTGQYGHGGLGELEVTEKFNEATNQTELYLEYGKWYHGWLLDTVSPDFYKVNFTTDIVQESCADRDCDGGDWVQFDNETLHLFGFGILANFTLGTRLDLLPPVPWAPDSCGK